MARSEESPKAFGRTVKWCRNELHLTQSQISELTGLHRTYIANVERGVKNIGVKNLMKIISALGLESKKFFEIYEFILDYYMTVALTRKRKQGYLNESNFDADWLDELDKFDLDNWKTTMELDLFRSKKRLLTIMKPRL